MCRMFSGQNPEAYSYQTRSIRLGGHGTSLRLEAAYWTILEEIAALDNLSLPKFLTKLHDEVLEFQGELTNFTSLLRCACLTYISEVRASPERRHDLPIPPTSELASARRLVN
jgi:predicted DNA-binding ribbon-helix-helix protein